MGCVERSYMCVIQRCENVWPLRSYANPVPAKPLPQSSPADPRRNAKQQRFHQTSANMPRGPDALAFVRSWPLRRTPIRRRRVRHSHVLPRQTGEEPIGDRPTRIKRLTELIHRLHRPRAERKTHAGHLCVNTREYAQRSFEKFRGRQPTKAARKPEARLTAHIEGAR